MIERLIKRFEGGHDPISGAQIGIIASRFNEPIVEDLLSHCLQTLIDNGIDETQILLARVPGAFEIPVATKCLIEGHAPDAVITLGAVIRGETPHFDYICSTMSDGIAKLSIQTSIPIILGVLTVDTIQQARERSGVGRHNKGSEAAYAAIEMISLFRKIHATKPM